MKFIKKALLAAMCTVLAAGNASAYNIGDVIGNVLATDIVTYVNGQYVPSYNIAGRTAILTQALCEEMEFSVYFDEETRVLTISDSEYAGGTKAEMGLPVTAEQIGKVVGKVYYTDIVAKYNNTVLESFNIGGLTCVYADELAKLCGEYIWDEEARTVSVNKKGYKGAGVTKISSERVLEASETVATLEKAIARWGSAKPSQIIRNSDGTYCAFEAAENINIERYDAALSRVDSFAIRYELPIFGGLYCGKDYNYIAFGQENMEQDNSREVIKIVIYDKNFVKISEVPIYNCKTTVPFDASGCSITENDRYLVLHTSRSQYKNDAGEYPQTQLTVIVDKTTWEIVNSLGMFQPNHTSHALNGLAFAGSDSLITADLSDAAPMRGVILRELDFYGNVNKTKCIFNVGGNLAANCTGVMTGGLENTSEGYLTVLSAVDPLLPSGYNSLGIEGVPYENRNVYAVFTDKETWEHEIIQLATYSGRGVTASVPKLVKISDDKFVVMWTTISNYEFPVQSGGLFYAVLDARGQMLSNVVYCKDAALSDSCTPIAVGENVVWYVNTENGRDFYIADLSENTAEEPRETETEEASIKDIITDKPKEDTPFEVDGI
ncbi:MAG: hypothetical protein UIL37_05365 [Clostridia bacterium]|nr:hypothetical protein [Clostridia bacterium]